MNSALARRVLAIRSVPSTMVSLTAAASYVAQISAILQGWPLWAIALVTLLPWIPILTLEMVWTYRHYTFLALFSVLVITQGGHVIEHIVQMVQIHLLGLRGAEARGVFGALDIEWVHFSWNTWVLIAVVLLLWRFPRNPWLWLTLVLAGWHELEHVMIMSRFLTTGQEGTPGLLARGGLIAGGLPLIRPDLHFLYNVVETVPLVIGFVYQLQRSYDEWLKRALPHLSDRMLVETTNRLQPLRFAPDESIIREGELPDRFYIIAKGEVGVRRKGEGGPVELGTLSAGQFFGEIGLLTKTPRTATVYAKSPVEVLALDHDTFQAVVQNSEVTAEHLGEVARQRLGNTTTGPA